MFQVGVVVEGIKALRLEQDDIASNIAMDPDAGVLDLQRQSKIVRLVFKTLEIDRSLREHIRRRKSRGQKGEVVVKNERTRRVKG